MSLQRAVWLIAIMFAGVAHAQVAGPADASRIDRRIQQDSQRRIILPPLAPVRSTGDRVAAPPGSEKIRLRVNDVVLQGARGDEANPEILASIYAEYIGHEVTLDKLWELAAKATTALREHGYFLSNVYVPPQDVTDGHVKLKLVSGYVSEVSFDPAAQQNTMVVAWVNRLLEQHALKLEDIESLLLRLNDLGGSNYRAVLALPEDRHAPEGATRLNILSSEEKPTARFTFDNSGSRYLGPWEVSQSIAFSPVRNHKTTLTAMATTQIDELKYVSVSDRLPLSYDWSLELTGSITDAAPGDTLAIQQISSISTSYGLSAIYRILSQRNADLSAHVGLEARDTRSKILATTRLTDDHIRTIDAGINYRGQWSTQSQQYISANASKGLEGLGASAAGATNLSRAEAKPGFTKAELSAVHMQSLPQDFMLMASASGQTASGPLYASEEFGYGGQSFGRAYDNSEITGDHGVAASVELRYQGIPAHYDTQMVPYVYYDIGKVWNEDTGGRKPLSGSSAGGGLRVQHASGLSGSIGLAYPLTRKIAAPLDDRTQGPRVMVQAAYDF